MNNNVLFATHFKQNDPKLYQAYLQIASHIPHHIVAQKNYFARLCRIIVGQQLSGQAARAIWNRFKAEFPGHISAKKILAKSEAELRTIGMSYAKARSLHDLAEKVANRELTFRGINELDTAEVHERLIQVKGIGPWSVEMFLMFTLGREDIFSFGDLGLQKGFQKVYGLKSRPTVKQLERKSKQWSPYRTYAALILWTIADTKEYSM